MGAACGDDTTDGSGGTSDGGVGGEAGVLADGGAVREGGGGEASTPTSDVTPPTVLWSMPSEGATNVSPAGEISVTFSEAMAAATLTTASFSVKQGAAVVPGDVRYFDGTATFVPAAALSLGVEYTATITTAATDAAGNALATPHTWSFRTDTVAPLGPSPVLLGAAGSYVVLAKSAISNVPTSAITGNVAVSPAAASYITGFALTKAGTKWTSPQVTGGVFAADNDAPTPSKLTTAVGAMEAAYTDAAGRPTPTSTNLGGGAIGGLVLAPGLYKFTSAVTVATDVTLSGTANDVWIFQISGDLTLSAAKSMILTGGARPKNIVWQVAGTVGFGATSHAEGIVLSKTGITLETGASSNGRLLAQTAVSLAGATVKAPAP
jgi:hypothetical protein